MAQKEQRQSSHTKIRIIFFIPPFVSFRLGRLEVGLSHVGAHGEAQGNRRFLSPPQPCRSIYVHVFGVPHKAWVFVFQLFYSDRPQLLVNTLQVCKNCNCVTRAQRAQRSLHRHARESRFLNEMCNTNTDKAPLRAAAPCFSTQCCTRARNA